jgi:hypothetical protein
MSTLQPTSSLLREFYALTTDGIWRVSAERNDAGEPTVVLIHQRPGSSDLTVGHVLHGGTFVAVNYTYLALYHAIIRVRPENTCDIGLWEHASENYRGERTGQLIAYFLEKQQACRANDRNDLTNRVHDFEPETVEVLRAIGPDHPVFTVCRRWETSFPRHFCSIAGIGLTSRPQCPVEAVAAILHHVPPPLRAGCSPAIAPHFSVVREPKRSRQQFTVKGPLIPALAPSPPTEETVEQMKVRIYAELADVRAQYAARRPQRQTR